MAAGFVATALLSVGVDAMMHATGVFPPGQPMSDVLFIWAMAYRMAFTVLGGAITAYLSPRKPMIHVLVLGAIGVVAALAGTIATWNRGPEFGPKWYPILLVMTAVPSVWAGGMLVRRHDQIRVQ